MQTLLKHLDKDNIDMLQNNREVIQGDSKQKINSIHLDTNSLTWAGEYFADNPVTLKAIANTGYKFDGWSGTITSNDLFLSLFVNRTTNFVANFSVDTSATNEIVINEINCNSSAGFDTGDWIELYNRSDEIINLGNWVFRDGQTDHFYKFPFGTILDPGQYLVLVEDVNSFSSRYANVLNYIGKMNFGLSSYGESIKLLNDESQLVDSLTYDEAPPWPTAAGGATLGLVDPLSDNAIAENWLASNGNGSPGKLNSVVSSLVEINNENIPEKFHLSQNYPNPFNSKPRISFELEKGYRVTINVFDVNGKIIEVVVNKKYQAGKYSQSIKFTENLASGVYFYQILLDELVAGTKKMILIR